MDSSVTDEGSESVASRQPDERSIPGSLPPARDRRREKPLLSCTFCRSRKVRCDRQHPCNTCVDRGISSTCSYRSRKPGNKTNVSVGDRIHHLESLVRSLAQQQQQQQQQQQPQNPSEKCSPKSRDDNSNALANELIFAFNTTPLPATSPPGPSTTAPLASVADDDTLPSAHHPPFSHQRDQASSPVPSEHGSMRPNSHGSNYVGSFHWAAVLDSISDLREHYEDEEEARVLAANDQMLHQSLGPRILYEPVQTTKQDILAVIPARPAADRMVARYFNAQGVVPETLHRGKFLREYEKFWQEPNAVSVAWIGLLFSVMSLSTLYQQSTESSEDPEIVLRVHMFRENVIHCLVLCQWTRGGDYVLETLINYLTSELFLSSDSEVGLWLLQGMLVQLSLSLGYHRDPRNFPSISPFAGEMRRRVWAVIAQMDLRLSSQMALPRLLNLHQYDTAEPRNLFDTDFDENTTQLPESRPDTEVTPVLFGLARTRIDMMNGLVNDLINDTHEHPYEEIIDLDHKLQHAEASLSPVFRWQPLSQSFTALPQIIMHRLLLQLAIQRVSVWLHRKYLSPSCNSARYKYSRLACIRSAMRILEFQQIVEEETQKDGLLYQVRWMFTSSRLRAVFLLGISILCYYLQLTRTNPDASLGDEMANGIHDLLRKICPLWRRLSAISPEARQVVQILNSLLEINGEEMDHPQVATASENLPFGHVAGGPSTLGQSAWELYQDSAAIISSLPMFPHREGFSNREGPAASVSSPYVSMADLLLTNTTEFDQWMDISFS